MSTTFDAPKVFSIGSVFVTASVAKRLKPYDVLVAVQQHRSGDWGEVSESDHEQNELALREGGRLMSVHTANDTRFWIITEADRSHTTVLLPSDY